MDAARIRGAGAVQASQRHDPSTRNATHHSDYDAIGQILTNAA
jgi:hypothetical protein